VPDPYKAGMRLKNAPEFTSFTQLREFLNTIPVEELNMATWLPLFISRKEYNNILGEHAHIACFYVRIDHTDNDLRVYPYDVIKPIHKFKLKKVPLNTIEVGVK
jgi:hypothetical protein